MPKSAVAERDPLRTLAVKMAVKDGVFYVNNTFSMYAHDEPTPQRERDLLEQLKPLLSADDYEAMKTFFAANKAAHRIMANLGQAHRQAVQEAANEVLEHYATSLGKGWYEFFDRSRGETRQVQVLGFDSCYRCTDGKIAGSLRVSPQGNGSSEPWRFAIRAGKMEVYAYA